MKKKIDIRKKFIGMLIIATFFIFIITQGNVYATQLAGGAKAYFGLEPLMTKTNVGYSMYAPNTNNASRLWNIIRYTDSNYSQYYNGKDGNIYCLKSNVGFATDEESGKRQAEYDTYYNMKTERTDIKNHNTVLQGLVEQNLPETSINRYNAILALLDRFYLPGESTQADKNTLVNKILSFAGDPGSPYNSTLELIEGYTDKFTEDDINAIQQAALWYLTNSTSKDDKYDLLENRDGSWLYYTTTGDKSEYSPLNNYRPNRQQHDEGEARCYMGKILYDMLIEEAKENASAYANIAEQSEPPAKIETQGALKGKVVGSNYVIGPIKITESTKNKTPYTIDFQVDKSYQLSNESGVQIQGKTVQQLVKEKQDIYISIPVSSVTDSVKVNISIKYEERTMTLWTAYQESNAVRQPLAEVTTQTQTVSGQLTFTPEKEFDLALRKYITQINDTPIPKEKTREPVIEKGTISTKDTATYKHRKSPVEVKTNDYIIYSITIYNEGEAKGRATKIVDQLPAGLKYISVEEGPFTGNCDGDNLLTLTRTVGNETNLNPYTGGELASETVKIKCQVTAEAAESDKTLTNVAWIAQEVNGLTGDTITNEPGEDRDSVPEENPGTTRALNQNNMDDYTGKQGNPTDLENPNNYFEGEQDDDDFEKVKVKKAEGEYTVQLEKVDSSSTDKKLNNAQFKVIMPDNSVKNVSTSGNGQIDLGKVQITQVETDDTITIEEITPPEGYKKLIEKVTLKVTKQLQNGKFVATAINKETSTENLSATVQEGVVKIVVQDEPMKFDLALRKYITKINGEPLSEDETRTPVIEKEIISSNGTAKYKHRKDPKVVQTGDYITYSITIYNEGERKGRATKIVDQLPEGLKFIEVEKGNFTGNCNPDTNLLTLTRTQGNNTNLDPYTGGELESETVDIKCQVTADATSGSKTLTNVAWIAEGIDGVTGQPGNDKDSAPEVNPGTTKGLTKDNMDGYTGKEGNPSDFENPNNYFEGEQDDDDFEKVQVKNLVGAYTVRIEKEDSKDGNTKLANAQFKITMPDKSVRNVTTGANGQIDLGTIQMKEAGTDTIIIEETAAPEGYDKLIGTVTLNVEKELQDVGLVAKSITEVEDSDGLDATVTAGAVKIIIKDEPKDFDLALRKYITKINGEPLPVEESRNPTIEKGSIDTDGTATYKHMKKAVSVRTGDYITYSLTVYNEGGRKGRATKIVDQLPEGLKFIEVERGNFTGSCDENTNLLTLTRIEGNETNLNPYEGGELASETIEIKCQVVAVPTTSDKNLVNVAWIAEEVDGVSGEKITDEKEKDKDSTPNDNPATNPDTNVNKDNTSDYKGDPSNPDDLTDPDKHYKGQEDDDDFEKVVVPAEKLDLRLKKFIAEVNDQKITDRIRDIDVSKLNTLDENGKVITDAEFDINKTPVQVKVGDIVTYKFRIYNEGMLNGYAEEITEEIPQGLEYLYADLETGETTLTEEEKEAIEYNKTYLWGFKTEDIDENGRVTKITSNYLSKETNEENNLIKAFGENTGNKTKDDLDYKELSVKLKVVEDISSSGGIRNEACISKEADENGNPVEEDRDSDPDEWKKYEDDEDYDTVVLQSFDLALKKFITKVEDRQIDTRIPQLNYNAEKDEIEYSHSKEPVTAAVGNTVEYTIRVFNEGETNGYAAQILDDIPDGLEYLPENETNKEYGWKMYRQLRDGESVIQVVGATIRQDEKTYVETDDVNEAEVIVTNYLSKEQGEARIEDGSIGTENPNLLKAFNKEEGITETNPDHKDVKVAFKIVEPSTSNKVIVNSAQISRDTDEDGNDIDDEDSEPGKWNDGEDDQDQEFVELKNFDLTLKKWVTQAIVINDGKQTVTQTGHDPYDDPEQVVKVEIKASELNKVTVKFKYSIRVTNEGDVEGYAKEVTDYVPSGLKFVAEDNPGWTDEGNNVISTRLLENTLLNPGEYADIDVVLTWINNENGLGSVLENTAEISEDYNEYGVPDKDSTPDNKKTGEDDLDIAPVLLSVKTGQIRIYFTLGFIVLTTISVGIIIIKKYVL